MKYRFVEREKYFESKTSLSSLRSLNRLLGKNKWIKKKIKTKGRKLRSYSESFERSIYFLNVRFDGFTSVISSRYSRSDNCTHYLPSFLVIAGVKFFSRVINFN